MILTPIEAIYDRERRAGNSKNARQTAATARKAAAALVGDKKVSVSVNLRGLLEKISASR
jgi:hypothetical protein